jgi:hypothetical protein
MMPTRTKQKTMSCFDTICHYESIINAGVAELADALDLGSSTLVVWRFDSSRPHSI